LDEDHNESESEESDEDTQGSGDFHGFRRSVSVDGVINECISKNKLQNYASTLKALARAFLYD
jgi:hypothetical protein